MAATADAPAVRDLNLQIADGEFMVLVGPSGCGKTTALRMVAGLEDITAGELRIGGTVVNDCVDAPPVVTDEVLELAADLARTRPAGSSSGLVRDATSSSPGSTRRPRSAWATRLPSRSTPRSCTSSTRQPVKWSVKAFHSVLSCPNEISAFLSQRNLASNPASKYKRGPVWTRSVMASLDGQSLDKPPAPYGTIFQP